MKRERTRILQTIEATLRLAFYGRFSSDRQKDVSITQQRQVCERYATQNGNEIVAEYADRAVSGTSIHQRKELQRLLADMKSPTRSFNAVILHDLSRLSRDQADLLHILKVARFRSVEVISVFEGYSSNDSTARLSETLRGFQNEEFIAKLKADVRRGMEQAFDDGYSVGTRSFGYTSQPLYYPDGRKDPRGFLEVSGYKVIPDLEQVPIVQRIFELRLTGIGCGTIAIQINEEFPNQAFTPNWIRSILSNPIYIGTVRWNRTETVRDPDTGRACKRPKPEKEWKERLDPSLAIIEKPIWDAVQKVTRHPTGQKPFASASRHILSGLLICGGQDEKTGKPCRNKIKIVQHDDYACPGNFFHHGCNNYLRINRFSLEELAIDKIRSFLPAHIQCIANAVRTHQKSVPREQRDTAARIERLKQEAQELLTVISQRKYKGFALEQAQLRYEQTCEQIDVGEASMVNPGEEVAVMRYDAGVIRRVLDNLPEAMTLNREAGQHLMRTIIKEMVISAQDFREGQCPLCDKQFTKLTVIHTRQHGFEREEFFRKYPTVGFTHSARIAMAFNPVGIAKDDKIVMIDIRGVQKNHNDNLSPVVFTL